VDARDRRAERRQLLPERERREVAAVDDQVGAAAEVDAARRQLAVTAREVCVRDDGDALQAVNATCA
jgi:hypothetical protein